MIAIHKRDGSGIRAMLNPDTRSQQERQLMGVDNVSISVSVDERINFELGDYADVFGDRYTLNYPPEVTKTAKRKFIYNIVLEGLYQCLGKTEYLFLDQFGHFTESQFPLKANAEDFLRLIIYNLERMYPGEGWIIGSCITTDYKDLEFDGENCLEVLAKLAETFETEYLIEGRKVSLYKKQLPSGIVLEYGFEKPLTSLNRRNRDNSNVVTRLYAYGSSRNIGSNYRNGAKRLRMGETLFIEKHIGLYGASEKSIVFDDVYPHRQGLISAVDDPFMFYDSAIDFNVNSYLLPGVSAKLTFITGLLSGYQFEVSAFNHTTKKFTILANTDDQTVTVPSVDLSPAVGDKYVLTDITMPLTYVMAAEVLLRSKAQAWLDLHCSPAQNVVYSCDFNTIWFKQNSGTVQLTQTLTLRDADLDVNRQIRIIGFTRNLRQSKDYSAQLSDTIKPQSTLVKIINGI